MRWWWWLPTTTTTRGKRKRAAQIDDASCSSSRPSSSGSSRTFSGHGVVSFKDFSSRTREKDPYERNANSRGDVCEDRGFHYDGLSFVDAHKAQFSVDFDEYERYKNAFQNGLCHHQFKTKFDDMRDEREALVYADDDPTAGFGSRVLRICSAFFASVHFGRPFAYAKVGRWTYSKGASRGNDCYFQKSRARRRSTRRQKGCTEAKGLW